MTSKKTKVLIIAVVVLLWIWYVRLYTNTPPPPYEILQLSLSKLNMDILNEKQLIIINEQIINVNALLTTVFAYTYILKDERFLKPSSSFARSISKYTIITSPFKDTILDIATPDQNQENVKYTTIKLLKNKVIILPARWFYRTQDEKIKRIILDDPITMIAYRLS